LTQKGEKCTNLGDLVYKSKLDEQFLLQIVKHYQQRIREQKKYSLDKFFSSLQKEKEVISVDFISSGSYGMIFKFTYFQDGGEKQFAIKFSMIYEDNDVNSDCLSTNVEHIFYGVLYNILQRCPCQNIIFPYYSFFIDYDDFYNNILKDFLTEPKVEKAMENFKAKKKKIIYTRCLLMEYIHNSQNLIGFILKNYKQMTIEQWKVLFFQICYILHIVQFYFPSFKHNDLKPDNILVQS